MKRHVLAVLVFGLVLAPAFVAGGEGGPDLSGKWQSSFGVMDLVQKGDKLTGTYGDRGQFQFEGKVADGKIAAQLHEGDATGDATYDVAASGNALHGRFRWAATGNQGEWHAWRQDVKAGDGPPSKWAGTWFTENGLMELTQTGAKVEGKYAVRGTSSIAGEVKGRRLTFTWQGFRGGDGWLEMSKDGKTFGGAAHTQGFPNWFGWSGRITKDYVHSPKAAAGKIVDGVAQNLLAYHVRAPEGYDAKKKQAWPAILILHGSNMTSKDYVATIAGRWPDLAKDFFVIGIDGETGNVPEEGKPATFNYTYVNFVGPGSTSKGFPGTDRESPPLVVEAMQELKKLYGIKKWLVGGHSQGAFLTYTLFMHYPAEVAGAFPISGGLLVQAAPEVFKDEAVVAAQKCVPLAIVHAENDSTVEFGMGKYAHEAFEKAGWPMLHFFTSSTAAHMFAMLPVHDAIRWLDALSSDDAKALLDFADKQAEEKEWKDVSAALARAKALDKDSKFSARIAALESKVPK